MDFSKRYNLNEFVKFLQTDFLPEDVSFTDCPEAEIQQGTKYIKTITKLGTCPSLRLAVYEARHTSTNDARVGLSKEIFRFMANKSERRALVLFVPEGNESNYRFSLISIELTETESGDVKRSYSNPRRYSYYLGEGIAYYTPNKYLNEAGRVKDTKDLTERFSVEVLTKAFYQELSDWYAWAVKEVRFPNKLDDPTDDDKFNAESTIRLVTRLIFVWFLKQKKLIPDQFFDEKYIADNLLENFNPNVMVDLFGKSTESRYYKAILQNLFFAMLNSPITQEGKSELSERRFRTGRGDYDNNKLMRYESMFMNPQLFVDLANKTVPFLNGGLFDCLDDKDNGYYLDGFSDRKEVQKSLIVPDYLFFGEEVGKNIDLSEWYGDKKKKKVSARGIIDILKRYNFTVEENTPFDQDVSLDPELLGKVFENLLASYNPETQTTARKQTGSFYTPREIVQYMVDESLVAHLKRTVGDELETKYRALLQYTDDEIALTGEQKKRIMQSLYECKILDPACGSGAFPVGMLQQMVHILGRIDPDNTQWKEMLLDNAAQESREAFQSESSEERSERLRDIEQAFDEQLNNPDYARKLYLIENCLYGVDIQPIAIQISKLRFFISLVVDQKTTDNPVNNFGIRPLPNLEAKFVAANTLIPLAKTDGNLGRTPEIMETEAHLKEANHKIFNAKTVKTKRKWKERLKVLRSELIRQLSDNGFLTGDAINQLASWNMFDQNASASFFDADWMFGVKEGFDIAIGNPPYISTKTKNFDKSYKYLYQGLYSLAIGFYDLYNLFIEKMYQILVEKGVLTFIIPTRVLSNENFQPTRKFIYDKLPIHKYVNAQSPFENVSVEANIMVCRKNMFTIAVESYDFSLANKSFIYKTNVAYDFIHNMPFMIFPFVYETDTLNLFKKTQTIKHKKLGDYIEIIRGFECGYNDPAIGIGSMKFIKAEAIDAYYLHETNLLNCDPDFTQPSKYKTRDTFTKVPKLVTRFCANEIQFAIDEKGYCNTNSVYNCIFKDNAESLKYFLLAILNSKLITFWFNTAFMNIDTLFPHIQKNQLETIPIPIVEDSIEKHLSSIVNNIIDKKREDNNVDISVEKQEIDYIIYRTYLLDYDEVKIIDPATPITREEYENFNL